MSRARFFTTFVSVLLLLSACQREDEEDRVGEGAPAESEPPGGTPPEESSPAPEEPTKPPAAPGWQVQWSEDFEDLPAIEGDWIRDPVPDDGRFSDAGEYFLSRGVVPPEAYRATVPFGDEAWLTVESYSRSPTIELKELVSVVPDPAGGPNRVLRLASPAHTDATVIRSSEPLPPRYRVSLRVGYASFGDGLPGLNGYDGGETAGPWWPDDDATRQNGFYWLTILDAQPRPHNNTWIHHHRKVVIDSDNHYPPWMEIFDGESFIKSGEHPVMMFALDGRGRGDERTGKPFIAWANGAWQPSGAIRAVDSYLDGEWYDVTVERFDTVFTLSISGRFRYGGVTTYRASIDAAENCIWHFNRTAAEDAAHCQTADWDSNQVWPDWFMFGDPHNNYYEGEVFYDDVRLEVWHGAAAR